MHTHNKWVIVHKKASSILGCFKSTQLFWWLDASGEKCTFITRGYKWRHSRDTGAAHTHTQWWTDRDSGRKEAACDIVKQPWRGLARRREPWPKAEEKERHRDEWRAMTDKKKCRQFHNHVDYTKNLRACKMRCSFKQYIMGCKLGTAKQVAYWIHNAHTPWWIGCPKGWTDTTYPQNFRT